MRGDDLLLNLFSIGFFEIYDDEDENTISGNEGTAHRAAQA